MNLFDEIVESEGVGDGGRNRARDLLPPKILRMGAAGQKVATAPEQTEAEDSTSVLRWAPEFRLLACAFL